MTVKQLATLAKMKSSHEVAQKLSDIEQRLIRKNEFTRALAELMLLASENLQDAQVWLLIGLVYTRMAHWQNAISVLETALKLDPQNKQVKQLMALSLFSVGQKKEGCHLIDEVTKSGGGNSAQWMLRAYLHAHTYSDPMKALEVARDWGKRFADPLTRNAKPLILKDRNPEKKLKIGYVTADFREHSVAFFMQPILENHNHDDFDIHVYSNGPEDDLTIELKKLVKKWTSVIDMNDDQMLNKIREDNIDILVDLSGFTHGHRLQVFARRAAPVQVTWLGYKPTLGMKAMDYRFFNRGADYFQKFYSEKLFKLLCPATYVPPAYSPLCKDAPYIRNGYITFVSLNNSSKITDENLLVWREILRGVKDSRLLIYVKEKSVEEGQIYMKPRLEALNIPLDRVSIIAQQPLDRFMETGFIADIMLDTFPICGGTTVLHSIWMGLPVNSMFGKNDVENSSAITVRSLKEVGKVATNNEEYINNAISMANDGVFLSGFRSKCRDILGKSNLMDYVSRVKDVEDAYRQMWKERIKK